MEENKKEVTNSKVNGYGVAALVTGIISLVSIQFIIISIIFAIIAIVCGIVGMFKPNKGMAKAGLVLGGISLLVTLVLYIFLNVLDISLFTIPSWYKQ